LTAIFGGKDGIKIEGRKVGFAVITDCVGEALRLGVEFNTDGTCVGDTVGFLEGKTVGRSRGRPTDDDGSMVGELLGFLLFTPPPATKSS
jgi:hypothetical protein